MPTDVIMPQMGESIFEGTITKWLKKPGEKVQRDEPLFEISTDKVDTEIPAPASGVVQDILIKEGETVQINTVVAVIGDGAPAQPPAEEAKQPPKPEAKPKEPPRASEPPKESPKEVRGPSPVAGPTQETEAPEEAEEIRSSPLVRRIAKENRVDLSELAGKGTGINGRITKSDILSYIEQSGKKEAGVRRP